MKFEVHPPAPSGPLQLVGHEDSGFLPFSEQLGVAGEGPVMFVAVVAIGDGCAPPAGVDPGVVLRVVGGAAVEPLPPASPGEPPSPVTIADASGVAVAFATLRRLDRGVYRVRIVLTDEGSAANLRWELRIANRDSQALSFTWVVADSEDEAKKPWIDFGEPPKLEAGPSGTATGTAQAFNLGTGDLTIGALAAATPGSPFEVIDFPRSLAPNSCGDVKVRFTAPPELGKFGVDYVADSNDRVDSPGHPHRLTLSGSARVVPGSIAILHSDGADKQVLTHIDPASGKRAALGQTARFSFGSSVAIDKRGNLIVAEHDPPRVVRVDGATGEVSELCAGGMLVGPEGIALEPGGSVLVVDRGAFGFSGGLIRVGPDGRQTEVVRNFRPVAVAVQPTGRILAFVDGSNEASIHAIDPQPGAQPVKLIDVPTDSETSGQAMAIESADTVLVADERFFAPGGGITVTIGHIRRCNLSNGQSQPLAEGPQAAGLALERPGSLLIAGVDVTGGTSIRGVIRFDLAAGTRTLASPSELDREPRAIAVAPG